MGRAITHPGLLVLEKVEGTSPQHPVWCRVNVGCGPAEQRLLLTGLHSVADIFCESCKTTLGWKYVSAPGTPNLGVGITLAP